jgi:hypothetical protein
MFTSGGGSHGRHCNGWGPGRQSRWSARAPRSEGGQQRDRGFPASVHLPPQRAWPSGRQAGDLRANGLGAFIATATRLGDWPRISLGIGLMSLFVVGFNRLVRQRLYNLAESRYHL